MSKDKSVDEDEEKLIQLKAELKELEEVQKAQEESLLDKKIEIARLEGDCVETMQELKCPKHPDFEFISVGNYIVFGAGISDVKVRACEGCVKELFKAVEKKDAEPEKADYRDVDGLEYLPFSSEAPLAYKCSKCGWVYGVPREESFNSLGVTFLAGAKGFKIYCTLCGKWLDDLITARA